MTKDPRVYLAHILECAQKIERFTADGKERFFQDAMVQDAVAELLPPLEQLERELAGEEQPPQDE